jgi:hypothetical protein
MTGMADGGWQMGTTAPTIKNESNGQPRLLAGLAIAQLSHAAEVRQMLVV